MLLTVGTNQLGQTDGVIHICGKRQIALEWGPARGDLLLTMDLYGEDNRHIGRLRRNEWTFNDHNRFALKRGAKGFTLTDSHSGQVILQAQIVGADAVVITEGRFRSATGDDIEIVAQTGLETSTAS